MATTHNPSKDKLVGDLKSLMSDAEELLKLTAEQQGGKLDDLRAIKELAEIGVDSAILGKSLYARAFTLQEALEVAK